MRSGKTEDAMAAAGLGGAVDGLGGRVLCVVETKLETGRARVGLRGQTKSAECDQQALRGDSIGDDNADHRSPKSPRPYIQPEHAAAFGALQS
jgi:hypothetical protein